MKKLMILAAVAAMAVGAEAASTFYWSMQDGGTSGSDIVRDGTTSGKLQSGVAYLFYATMHTEGGARATTADAYSAAVNALVSAIDKGTYSFGVGEYVVTPTGGAGFNQGLVAIAKADVKDGLLYDENGKRVTNLSGGTLKFSQDIVNSLSTADTFFMVFTTDSLKEGVDGSYYCVESKATFVGKPFPDNLPWARSDEREISTLTGASGNWVAYTAVPEPTSGLLLLLGVAGLALRRKRA